MIARLYLNRRGSVAYKDSVHLNISPSDRRLNCQRGGGGSRIRRVRGAVVWWCTVEVHDVGAISEYIKADALVDGDVLSLHQEHHWRGGPEYRCDTGGNNPGTHHMALPRFLLERVA